MMLPVRGQKPLEDFLQQETYAADGTVEIELDRIKETGFQGLHAYLAAILLKFDITDFDATAGGEAPVEDFHDLVNYAVIETEDGVYGPDQTMNGFRWSGVNAWMQGGPTSAYIEEEGDAAVAASTSNATRQYVVEYRFDQVGLKPSDTTPPIRHLQSKGGQLSIQWGSNPANTSSITGTVRIYYQYYLDSELRAVPRLNTKAITAPGRLTDVQLGRGTLVQLMLENAGDNTDGDFDVGRLKKDGHTFFNWQGFDHVVGRILQPEANANMQHHGIEPIDGGDPALFMPVYPKYPGPQAIGDLFTGRWEASLEGGSETQGNVTFLVTYLNRLTDEQTEEQLKSGCCDEDLLKRLLDRTGGGIIVDKSADKVGGVPEHMRGLVPKKLSVANLPLQGFGAAEIEQIQRDIEKLSRGSKRA